MRFTDRKTLFTDRIPLLSIGSIRTDRHMAYTDRYGGGVLDNPRCGWSAVTRAMARVLFIQTNMAAKKSMVHRRGFLKICLLKLCDIWENFYFYRSLINENFKMEVEQTIFVPHLIITVQLCYWLSKNLSLKIWSNKFQMVMINYSKLCASL